MDVALAEVAASPRFFASPAPYVLLDRRLRIRAVNAAYLQATNRAADELVGADMFEMFRTTPRTPAPTASPSCPTPWSGYCVMDSPTTCSSSGTTSPPRVPRPASSAGRGAR